MWRRERDERREADELEGSSLPGSFKKWCVEGAVSGRIRVVGVVCVLRKCRRVGKKLWGSRREGMKTRALFGGGAWDGCLAVA